MDLRGNDLRWTLDIEKSEEFLRKNLEESVAELGHESIHGEFFINKLYRVNIYKCDEIIFKRSKLTIEDLFYCSANCGIICVPFPYLLLEGCVVIDEEFVTISIPHNMRNILPDVSINFWSTILYNDIIETKQNEYYAYLEMDFTYIIQKAVSYCHHTVYTHESCIYVFALNGTLDEIIRIDGINKNQVDCRVKVQLSDIDYEELSGLDCFESKPLNVCYKINIQELFPVPYEKYDIDAVIDNAIIMIREHL